MTLSRAVAVAMVHGARAGLAARMTASLPERNYLTRRAARLRPA